MNSTLDVILVNRCNQNDGFRTVLPAKMCVHIVVIMALASAVLVVGVGAAVTAPEEEWNKTFGGPDWDMANSAQQTTDGGYILAGRTSSYGVGNEDLWLVKTDSGGNRQWDKTFGGIDKDFTCSIQQTTDGGYVLVGYTASYGGCYRDSWIVKTDSNGNKQWNKTFGGNSFDITYSVQQTSDGGYILAGCTESYGAGNHDFWLVKADSSGNEQWNRTFGGADDDEAFSVQHTSDGGYILAGYTSSYGAGDRDFWLVKTDSGGNKQWNRTFGGTDADAALSVHQTTDGGYILTGRTSSYGVGNEDIWLVKTDSGGNKQWDKTFGGTAYSVQQTFDGGYILAGYTVSYGAGNEDIWLVKTDSNGNERWNRTFGGGLYERAGSAQQTSDGGYILAGYTSSYGAGCGDFWLIKMNHPAETAAQTTTPIHTISATPTSTPPSAQMSPTSASSSMQAPKLIVMPAFEAVFAVAALAFARWKNTLKRR